MLIVILGTRLILTNLLYLSYPADEWFVTFLIISAQIYQEVSILYWVCKSNHLNIMEVFIFL